MWHSNDYLSIHVAYDWCDGGKACVLYAFTMLALFVQGRLYLSPLSLEVLGSLNILRRLVVLVMIFTVVFAARERLISIGVTHRHLGESMVLGLALGVSEHFSTGLTFAGFGAANALSLLTFFVGAL